MTRRNVCLVFLIEPFQIIAIPNPVGTESLYLAVKKFKRDTYFKKFSDGNKKEKMDSKLLKRLQASIKKVIKLMDNIGKLDENEIDETKVLKALDEIDQDGSFRMLYNLGKKSKNAAPIMKSIEKKVDEMMKINNFSEALNKKDKNEPSWMDKELESSRKDSPTSEIQDIILNSTGDPYASIVDYLESNYQLIRSNPLFEFFKFLDLITFHHQYIQGVSLNVPQKSKPITIFLFNQIFSNFPRFYSIQKYVSTPSFTRIHLLPCSY